MKRTLRAIRGLTSGVACIAFTASGSTLDIKASNPYGEIVARGNISVYLALLADGTQSNFVFDCDSSPTLARLPGNHLAFGLRAKQAMHAEPPCYNTFNVDVGVLAAGSYTITARAVDGDGRLVAHTDSTFEVMPVAGRCNPLPGLQPVIIAQHRELQPSQLRARVTADGSYADRLGDPVVETRSLQSYDGGPDLSLLDYPPLRNPTELRAMLEDTGEFRNVWGNGTGCGLPPPDILAVVIEFHHAGLDHYFYSGDPGEIAALDAGAPAGWMRTGQTFSVVAQPGCAPFYPAEDNVLGVVYRFYGIPGRGPASHFFTRDRHECYVVDQSQQWSLEGVPFWAWKANAAGACPDPARQVPLYRAWKPFGDSNHRFSTDRAVIDRMVAEGWIDEGAAMCVRKPASSRRR